MEATQKVDLQVIDRAYVLTRMFDAPLALVYKVWTEAEHFARWWGPHTFTNPKCEIDLKVGGKFLAVMTGPEGEANPLRGEFLEIVPNEKIVLRMYTDDHPKAWHEIVNKARGLAPDAAPAGVVTTVKFEAVGAKTKLIISQSFDNNADRDGFLQVGTFVGWSQSLVKMESLLATLATDRDMIIVRTIDAPLALVWDAFSKPEHIAKWWGPNGFTNTIHSFDLREGGEWLYTMHGPDGTDYPNWVRFDIVQPQVLIAYTHGAVPNDPEAFHSRITFAAVEGGKTHVKLHVQLASAEVRAGMFAFGAFEGGDQTLSRLEAFLQAR